MHTAVRAARLVHPLVAGNIRLQAARFALRSGRTRSVYGVPRPTLSLTWRQCARDRCALTPDAARRGAQTPRPARQPRLPLRPERRVDGTRIRPRVVPGSTERLER